MTVGSLFAGIGGFDLGFERAGFEIKWQVEIDPFCRRVLEKHWPQVRRYEDVRRVDGIERADVVCAGWPCQPVSSASRGRCKRSADPRFLWPATFRVVDRTRPDWFLGETHLDGPELEQVVSDLEGIGYEVAPPFEVPACAFGHDHWRPRLWILGHANGNRQPGMPLHAEMAGMSRPDDDAGRMGTTHGVSGPLDGRRMRALGNAVVPQIVEWIARSIQEAEEEAKRVTKPNLRGFPRQSER